MLLEKIEKLKYPIKCRFASKFRCFWVKNEYYYGVWDTEKKEWLEQLELISPEMIKPEFLQGKYMEIPTKTDYIIWIWL